ncbi:MAG: TIGR04086 family membrane protein [Firmicutes bacterium]|nr:TIGR04086 family membrane protein [Bacillota bacterium]
MKGSLMRETSRLHFDPRALIHGVLLSFICMGVMSLIFGTLCFYMVQVEKRMDLLVFLAGLASASLGGAAAARRVGKGGWLHGGLAGLGFVLVSYPIGLIWAAETVVTAVFIHRLLGGMLMGVLGGMLGVGL